MILRTNFNIWFQNFYISGFSELKNHPAEGKSFKQIWRNAAEQVRLRGKIKVEVFGLEVYVSCIKFKKDGKTEYLIVASKERNKYAIEEYKVRCATRNACSGV
ncbi:hypothetical protein BH20ACI1_BH20ACI1_29810 [soil metagenome]